MQDIVFYAAANETLGQVRDYSNMRGSDAPLLTLGVAVCLRMRLFAAVEVPTPYPVASFSGISEWLWSMDADFDRSTACKLVADEGGISVHTVTDTINGETMSFTEFVIPISDMNTEELAAWLGNEKMKSGLTGELVGHDSEGHAVFVLQIENFKVRNRVSGLGDPTALDQEYVTRSQAEQLVQTAVSSSAATKQDKLVEGGTYGINVASASAAGIANEVTLDHVYAGNTAIADGSNVIKPDYLPTASGTTPGLVKSADPNILSITGGAIAIAVQTDIAGASTTEAKAKVPTTSAVQTFVSGYVSGNALTSDYVSAYTHTADNIPLNAVSGLSGALQNKQNAISFDWGLEFDDDNLSLARYRTILTPTGASVTLQPGEAYKINATTSSKTLNVGAIPSGQWGIEGHLEIFLANTGYIVTGANVVLANALEPDAVNNCTVRFHDGMAIISVEDHIAGYIVTVNASSGAGSLHYAVASASNEYISINVSLDGQTLDLAGVVTSAGEKHVVGNGYANTILTGGVSCTSKTTFSNLTMDGVYVTGGTMTLGDVYISNGATVSVSGGGLVIEKVTGNGGVIDLGGTQILANQTRVTGVTVSGGSNNVSAFAGAFYVAAATCEMESCTLVGNNCSGAAGAVAVLGAGHALVSACIISGNSCVQDGGAMYCVGAGSPVTVVSSFITANSAGTIGGGKRGGGVFVANNATTVDLVGTTVTGNYAGYGRDVYALNTGVINASNCTLGDCYTSAGSYTFAGSNAIEKLAGVGGTVIISSGASINLTSSIAPGVGVTFEPGVATIIPGGSSELAFQLGGMTVPQIGNTNVVNLGGSHVIVSSGTPPVSASGATFTGGSSTENGGAFYVRSNGVSFTNCTFSGNTATLNGGAMHANAGGSIYLSGCTVTNNSPQDIDLAYLGSLLVLSGGCTIGTARLGDSATMQFMGANTIGGVSARANQSGNVIISSSASITLISSIAPGGGVTFASGGGTIIPSGSPELAYTLDNITVASVSNTNQLGKLTQPYGVKVTGAVFSGLVNSFGGAVQINNSTFEATSCQFISNTCINNHGGALFTAGATVTLNECVFSGNAVATEYANGTCIYVGSNSYGLGTAIIDGCTFLGTPPGNNYGNHFIEANQGAIVFKGTNTRPYTVISSGTLTISSGAVINLVGVEATTPINANFAGASIIVETGGCTVINSAGTSVTVSAGTYKTIRNDGTTTE